jgi:putative copper export protein
VVAATWLLAVQYTALGGDAAMLQAVVLHTQWGRMLAAQAAAFATAAAAFWWTRRAERPTGPVPPAPTDAVPVADRVAAAAAVAAAVAQAGLGHGGADEAAPAVAFAAAAAHVVGVAAWLGTLGVLAVSWFALSDPPPDPTDDLLASGPSASVGLHGSSMPSARVDAPAPADAGAAAYGASRVPPGAPLVLPLVTAFSRVALAGAALTASAGAVNAWLRLGGADGAAPAAARLAALTSTRYGGLLVAKLAVVAAVVAVGALNWRRNTPRLAGPGGVAALERATRAELALAGVALVLSAALAVTSPPGTE